MKDINVSVLRKTEQINSGVNQGLWKGFRLIDNYQATKDDLKCTAKNDL